MKIKYMNKKFVSAIMLATVIMCSTISVYASSYGPASFSMTGGIVVNKVISSASSVKVTTNATCDLWQYKDSTFDVILQKKIPVLGWSSTYYKEHPFNGSKTSKFTDLSTKSSYRVYLREYGQVEVSGTVSLSW